MNIVWYRVKNEERWLPKSIDSIVKFADVIYLFDDHSTDRTKEIALSYNKVHYQLSPFTVGDMHESRDKQWMWVDVRQKFPDAKWFFGLDGDEVLEGSGVDLLPAIIRKIPGIPAMLNAVAFQFLYMWDEPDQYRYDGVYGDFWGQRLFTPCTGMETAFNTSKFHCSWMPFMAGDNKVKVMEMRTHVRILHYGGYEYPTRLRKYVWYNLHDSNNFAEDRYRHVMWAGPGMKWGGETLDLRRLS